MRIDNQERHVFRYGDGMHCIICYGDRPVKQRSIMSAVAVGALTSFACSMAFVMMTGMTEPPSIPERIRHARISEPARAADTSDIESMSKEDLHRQLMLQGETFKAIAVLLEDVRTTVYKDNDGSYTIGAGYGLGKRIKSKGGAAVVVELMRAGISARDAIWLVDPKRRNKVTITKSQAVALLGSVQREYEKVAKRWLGGEYQNLNDSQRAAVTYLAYNVGATRLRKYTSLKQAIAKESTPLIKEHMKVSFKNQDGKRVSNKRVTRVLTNTFLMKEAAEPATVLALN